MGIRAANGRLAKLAMVTFCLALPAAGAFLGPSLSREIASAAPVETPTPVVDVSAPTVTKLVPSTFAIPISVQDISGYGIYAFQFHILYNPAVINPTGSRFGCSTTGTLAGQVGLQPTCNIVPGEEGRLRIAVSGIGQMSGAGVILNITFATAGGAVAGNVSQLNFENVAFYNAGGEVMNTPHNGQVTLIAGPTPTPTNTPIATPTFTPTNTPTATPTFTPTSTPTFTPTATPTFTPTATATATPTATPTFTPTATPTATPTPAACIGFSVPALTAYRQADVAVPVLISDLSDAYLTDIDLVVSFDPLVLAPVLTAGSAVSVTQTGTVSEGAAVSADQTGPGTVHIHIISATPLTGGGELLLVNMNVAGATGSSTVISFAGSSVNGGSVCTTTSAGQLTVIKRPTVTSLGSSQSPSVYGESVTFTAVVASDVPPVGGTVSFYLGGSCSSPGTLLGGPAALGGDGSASFSTSALTPADASVLACYSGTADHEGSGDAFDQSVLQRPLLVSIEAEDKVYDGSADAFINSCVLSGVISTDDVTCSGTSAMFDSPDAGFGKTVSAVITLSGVGAANYTAPASASTMANIARAPADCSVTGYDIVYDGQPHMAAGTCTGVLSEGLGGLSLSATVHTGIGIYAGDPWVFTDTTGNYLDTAGTVDSRIRSASVSGTVEYAVDPKPVPGVTMTGSGGQTVTASTQADGTYLMDGFAAGPYAITPARTAEPCPSTTLNGIGANDASLVARHLVGLITLNGDQLIAAKVSGNATQDLSSLDAALIAQHVVGICLPINLAGNWRFSPAAVSHPDGIITNYTDNYRAYLMGDVNGDWDPSGELRPAGHDNVRADAPVVSLPIMTAPVRSEVVVPVRVDNLLGRSVGAYQFEIRFDPSFMVPVQQVASVAGTQADGMSVVANSPLPGSLRVAVYGPLPVTGDGVYVHLRFAVRAPAGATGSIKLGEFVLDDGSIPVAAVDGRITVVRAPLPVLSGTADGDIGGFMPPDSK